MSALQWALLILSVAIVIAVVVISRRDREPAAPKPQRERPRAQQADTGSAVAEPVREQLDIFAVSPEPPVPEPASELELEYEEEEDHQEPAPPPPLLRPSLRNLPPQPQTEPAAPQRRVDPVDVAGVPPLDPMINPLSGKQYDEFGVGRPRRRTMPSLEASPANDTRAAELGTAAASQPPASVPPWVRAAPSAAPSAPRAAGAPPKVEQKIVALLIVEREGGMISGTKLHSALAAQGLQFGAKQIYHRLAREESVFAVASLTKPGMLIPAEATQFATPGLSSFMVLPGPVKPLNALHDMFSTTQALARALNAEVYDSKKQPLTSETMRALQADVEAWARAAQL
ncbi:MAG: Cell division protein ZipA [Hydrocarboniphaga sp.]|uniref:cell division protein ZipA C-terminal FtsZ-binding domain-containing protein n=1 Tax=Hydrocarboniphaga sp. TaxID=2033016 RepID=UPI00261E19DB|nr:cell division protein ZipA C-terminal FtsZ-binding domain-containing protein [Hydrocarboniphaga sp.]MDB5970760.1 Cell division protein ZipA [Hydrocarboniphaga sp.]